MKRNILISFLLAFSLLAVAVASDIDGKWVTKMQGPDGDMEMAFIFKVAKNDSLSGTIQSPMGEMKISNGKVNGDSFSFDVDFNGMAIKHNCKVLKDSISMKVSGLQDGEMEMILKSAK